MWGNVAKAWLKLGHTTRQRSQTLLKTYNKTVLKSQWIEVTLYRRVVQNSTKLMWEADKGLNIILDLKEQL